MKLTVQYVECAARRAGWSLSTQRAEQIVAVAGPRLEALSRISTLLSVDDDAGFTQVLAQLRYQPNAQGQDS